MSPNRMTPVEYEKAQAAFLSLRELDAAQREVEWASLEQTDAELAKVVKRLLQADAIDDSFLSPPSTSIRPRSIEPFGEQDSRANDDRTETYTGSSGVTIQTPRHIGPYRILQRIGEGGHGVVFMAEQIKPIRRKVAIKWIKPGMESKMILARFEAERQALAMMKHPSIANVIDAGDTDDGRPYFVMELVHGIPIDQFCDENEMTLHERLGLLRQVCDAVHHAHQKGIIHRDIKPANVLVTVDSGQPLAKVIDFGIAKAMHLALTEKTMFTEYGQIIGTLEYMSPEQATMSQNSADVRSDVYSLGALLYLLLTGRTPISKEELLKDGLWELKNVLQDFRPSTPSLCISTEGRKSRWRDHATSAEDLRGSRASDLDWITMKALAKEPHQRYESPAAFAWDLENFINGDAVSARPPSVWYTLKKRIQRNRVASIIVAAVLGSAIVSFGGVAWGYLKSQQNLADAVRAEALIGEKVEALNESLGEVERQRARADDNARRLAKTLKRQLLETAWAESLDGDAMQARATLADIAAEDRDFTWQFVNSVTDQMNWPSLRQESAGAIRQSSVSRQNGLMAIITTQSQLEVWDVDARKQIQNQPLDPDLYTSMTFSRDGRQLLVGRAGDAVQRIELNDSPGVNAESASINAGPMIRHGLGSTRDAVHDASGNRWFVTTGANFLVELDVDELDVDELDLDELDVDDEVLGRRLKLPSRVAGLSLSPDGNWLVVASMDGVCYLVMTSDLTRFETLSGSTSQVVAFRWTDDDLHAVNSSGDLLRCSIQKADGETDEEAAQSRSFTLLRAVDVSLDAPSAIELLDDGEFFIGDNRGRVDAVLPERNSRIPVRRYSPAIVGLASFEQPRVVAVTHFNGRVNLISWRDIDRQCRLAGQLDDVNDGIASTSSDVSYSGHADGLVKQWNTATGQLIGEATLHRASIFSLDLHEPQKRLATMAGDWQIRIADSETLQPIHTCSVGLGVRPVVFSRSGSLVAGGPAREDSTDLDEGTIDLWDVRTGQAVQRMAGHSNWVTQMQFSSDDSKLASLSLDGSIRLWSVETGRCLTRIDVSTGATAAGFGMVDDDRIAIAHVDGSISVVDLGEPDTLRNRHALDYRIDGLVSPADSSTLFVSSTDSPNLTIVDAGSLEVIASMDAGVGNILGMRSDRDSRQLQIMGDAETMRLWAFPSL